MGVVAVLDDGGEASALGAAQERREAISREVKVMIQRLIPSPRSALIQTATA